MKINFTLILFIMLLPTFIFAGDGIKEFKGLRYYYYKQPNTGIGVIHLTIKAGSIYDTEGKFGTSFILTNLLKKGGTIKYPTEKLLDYLDKNGIEVFANCDRDFIKIGVKFVSTKSSEAFKIFKQILFYPSFDSKEFENIRKETIEKIISYQNNNDYLSIHEGVVKLFKNSAYSHSPFGEIEDIKNITINDITEFYKKFFLNQNITITFAGDINQKDITNFIQENFKNTQKGDMPQKDTLPQFSNINDTIFKNKKLQQSYIYILFPSYGQKDKNFYDLKTLAFILGGNLTSILSEKIRKELGLAYSVFSINYDMFNTGFFVIGMQTENSKRVEAIETTKKILETLRKDGVNQNQVDLAKSYLIGKIPIQLQSLINIADSCSNGIWIGKSLPAWDYDISMYQMVTVESINKVINEIFDTNKMIISILGE